MAIKRIIRACIITMSCVACFPPASSENETLDAPVSGLDGAQLATFQRGDELFGRHFAFSEGLGPLFVASSCDACHPAEGRAHPELGLTRFGRLADDGTFDTLVAEGGPQLQTRAALGYTPEVLPLEATGVTVLLAPAVTGLGLLEAVEDATLLANEDPDDRDGDGISGRAQRLTRLAIFDTLAAVDSGCPPGTAISTPLIGRFGRKAASATLLQQVITAFAQDMGLSSPYPEVSALAGSEGLDDAPGAEIDVDTLLTLTTYLRMLDAPPRRDASAEGEALFTRIGCATCHTPNLTTGASAIEALSHVQLAPYSDLLLHDMGPELDDGYTEGSATTAEWRTTPLWGLGLAARFQGGTPYYLHDGRVSSLVDAIAYHGGEATKARDAFDNLAPEQRTALLDFLESL